jgi:hypothetical protein
MLCQTIRFDRHYTPVYYELFMLCRPYYLPLVFMSFLLTWSIVVAGSSRYAKACAVLYFLRVPEIASTGGEAAIHNSSAVGGGLDPPEGQMGGWEGVLNIEQ